MTSEKIVTQSVPPMSPSSRQEASTAPLLLPVCCVCGLIREETKSLSGRLSWVTWRLYRSTHNVQSTELLFTHGYCPACFLQAQIRMREFFKEQEGSENH